MNLYFASKDAELCYPLEYFKRLMEYEGAEEMTLYKATPSRMSGFFWCGHYQACYG